MGQSSAARTERSLTPAVDLVGHAAAWDLYFLAMSYERLGKPSEARDCYQKALHIQKTASLTSDEAAELEQFRAEADIVLGPGQIH